MDTWEWLDYWMELCVAIGQYDAIDELYRLAEVAGQIGDEE